MNLATRSLPQAFALILPALLLCSAPLHAQTRYQASDTGHSHDGLSSAAHNHGEHSHGEHSHAGQGDHNHPAERLAYRLKETKQRHCADAAEAEQLVQTLTRLKCEVRQSTHAGHIDVSYRCVQWKTADFTSHALAEQWDNWLTTSGFDVSHSHADPKLANGPEVVEFRLEEWKSIHGNDSPAAQRFAETLRTIGCDVRIENHGGHADILFRAPVWRDFHLKDHTLAEKWIQWLNSQGFETRHEH